MGFGEPQRVGMGAGEGVGTGARAWGVPGWKLCPGSGAGREEWTLGSAFVPAVHALRKRMAASRGRVSQRAHQAPAWRWSPSEALAIYKKTTHERSKEVTA